MVLTLREASWLNHIGMLDTTPRLTGETEDEWFAGLLRTWPIPDSWEPEPAPPWPAGLMMRSVAWLRHINVLPNDFEIRTTKDIDFVSTLVELHPAPEDWTPGLASPGAPKKSGDGKPAMELLPWDAIEAVAVHFAYGAKKFSERDWENADDPHYRWSTYLGALQRHTARFAMGEDLDPEGFSHMAAIATNALMLLAYVLRGHPGDDRHKVYPSNPREADGGPTQN